MSTGDRSNAMHIGCSGRLEVRAVGGVPIVEAGDDLPSVIRNALARAGESLRDCDVVAVASKLVSRAEGRFVDLSTIEPTPRALELAAMTAKDARMVELILRDTADVSRAARGVLVVRHRLGFVTNNASIDESNARPANALPHSGPWALILPESPDASAERIRQVLATTSGASIAVVVTDSLGRAFRVGTVGAAIGVAGLPPLWDRRGETDLFGRVLEHTVTALADQVAAAADLVAGQAAEGRGVVLVRGLEFPAESHSASELYRPPHQDLYA